MKMKKYKVRKCCGSCEHLQGFMNTMDGKGTYCKGYRRPVKTGVHKLIYIKNEEDKIFMYNLITNKERQRECSYWKVSEKDWSDYVEEKN
jgi:hypothetical protein